VIETGTALIVNDYDNWEGKAQIFTGDPETRGVGAPLRWQDQIIGGILVMNDSSARLFDQDDMWLLSLFADLASIAVKNADLHSRVKDFNQQLEVNIAQRVEELSRAKEEIVEKAEQLKFILAKTIHLQEEERARIARDMHDGVVQLITSARFEIQAARVVSGPRLTLAAQNKLTAAREVLEEAESEIRRAIYDLHSPVLDAVGLVAALQQHVNRFESLSGLACEILVEGTAYRLPPETEVAVFRMIEEALNNVAAHADASHTSVQLEFAPQIFSISIQDDGRGFDYAAWSKHRVEDHLGLLGMQERVESLSGKMQVVSDPELGTRILFRLPVLQG
jgi:signal transduction histidine kinase